MKRRTPHSDISLSVLRRQASRRVRVTNCDRLFFVQLCRWFPSILKVITIMGPETLARWHRAGFRQYWRWKSRSRAGRPPLDAELRALIQRTSLENPLWGAPRIHGELLKLVSATSTGWSNRGLRRLLGKVWAAILKRLEIQ